MSQGLEKQLENVLLELTKDEERIPIRLDLKAADPGIAHLPGCFGRAEQRSAGKNYQA